MKSISILLIEDNRILREGIRAMLEADKGFTVTAVSDGRNNVPAMARTVKPDMILMDLGLGSKDSMEVVQSVKRECPGIKVIGMGLAPTQSDIMEFVQAGSEGFILKNATVGEMLLTLRAVARGETVLPSSMTSSLFSQVAEHALLKGKRNLKVAIRMTGREKEVIALIAEGLSNKEIASKLGIATFTVKSHVHNIMEKLALHSRVQIALHARDGKPS